MKSWLKWLANTEYVFTVTVNEEDECRVYDFGNGLILTKWQRKNGGLIDNNGFAIPCGSNKMLQANLKEILGY